VYNNWEPKEADMTAVILVRKGTDEVQVYITRFECSICTNRVIEVRVFFF